VPLSLVAVCLVALFVLSYGAVAVFALRHQQLGRLAVREAVRRKGRGPRRSRWWGSIRAPSNRSAATC